MKVLIWFGHGLGDAVGLTVILKHLQAYRSNWTVDVAALIGKHSTYGGLCHTIYASGHHAPPCCSHDRKFAPSWGDCERSYADSPSTKAIRSLREDFGINPDPTLCSYSIARKPEVDSRARQYLESTCRCPPGPDGRYPAVLIHYEGNTATERKNIPQSVVQSLCETILEVGFTPIILDWDFRTSLANPGSDGTPSRIQCPDTRNPLWQGIGTGDAETIAALIEASTLMIGVDSGPLHVAGATSTPTFGIWTGHHPLHYFDLAENVTHFVPIGHRNLIREPREAGEAYFLNNYTFQVYEDLQQSLLNAIHNQLSQAVPTFA